jgi:hypothetical protein
MDRCGGAAARLPESGRKDVAIQVLAGTETVSDLAAQHGVSRKFVYAQTGKAVRRWTMLSWPPRRKMMCCSTWR